MKRLFSMGFGVVFAFVIATLGIAAQDPAPKVINGGVLNGKAVSLPKPEYPDAALKSGLKGAVGVEVTIDESGNVIFAQADLNEQRVKIGDDGSTMMELIPIDLSLREAAENAARQARFSPTLLSGQPVRIKGKIVYNFGTPTGDRSGMPTMFGGGVVNGKALNLPAPEYPAAAKAVDAQGTVAVSVTIDEEGNVVETKAVSGHPLLRSAAETAAWSAKFAPTLLSGKAVKVAGVLIYNFALPVKEN